MKTIKLSETMKAEIKDLKKGDWFKFNDDVYVVRRRWINDDKPLICGLAI